MPFNLPRVSRVALGVQYSLLTAAGTLLLIHPTQLLQNAIGAVVLIWAIFLVVGGVFSLAGTLTRTWIGEFLGLILLFTANVVWGGALITYAYSNPGPRTSAYYGMALLAWAAGLLYRWGEIRGRVRDVAAVQREKKRRRPRG